MSTIKATNITVVELSSAGLLGNPKTLTVRDLNVREIMSLHETSNDTTIAFFESIVRVAENIIQDEGVDVRKFTLEELTEVFVHVTGVFWSPDIDVINESGKLQSVPIANLNKEFLKDFQEPVEITNKNTNETISFHIPRIRDTLEVLKETSAKELGEYMSKIPAYLVNKVVEGDEEPSAQTALGIIDYFQKFQKLYSFQSFTEDSKKKSMLTLSLALLCRKKFSLNSLPTGWASFQSGVSSETPRERDTEHDLTNGYRPYATN